MKSQPPKQSGWSTLQIYTALAVVLIAGGIGGYLVHSSSTPSERASSGYTPSAPSASLPASPALPATALPSPAQLLDAQAQPLLQRLNGDPKDVSALIELGNLYFDAQQYSAAIGYYTRALNETPHNPDVRTDMGIAYYYSGDADRALQEFDRALKDDPRHSQTIFNVGVVRMGGKNDPKGAIAAWESLLKMDPSYRDRARVETMIAEARAKVK